MHLILIFNTVHGQRMRSTQQSVPLIYLTLRTPYQTEVLRSGPLKIIVKDVI